MGAAGRAAGALLLAGAAAAQGTFVVPGRLGGAEGDSWTHGVGRFAPMRSQFIYAASAMPPAPFAIQGIRLRPDGGRVLAGGHTLDVEAWVGSRPAGPAAGLSYRWAVNRGQDFRQAMASRKVQFPPAAGSRPAPFGIDLPLDRPWTYPGGAFLLEILTRETAFASYDYWLDAVATKGLLPPAPGPAAAFGRGCPETLALHCRPEGTVGGGLFSAWGETGITGRSVPVLDLLGTGCTRLGGLALPLELGFLGAPGCHLYVEILAARVALSDGASPGGEALSLWGALPPGKILAGAMLYQQWLALDPAFGPGGLAASEARMALIADGTFQGAAEGVHLFTWGRGFDGTEEAARFATGKLLVLELR